MSSFAKSTLFLIVFYLAGCASQSTQPARAEDQVEGLRFDGLYNIKVKNYWHFLRFYADGTVLGIAVNSHNPEKMKPWFYKGTDNRLVAKGSYELEGETIKFITYQKAGIITNQKAGSFSYVGKVLTSALSVDMHSRINGYRASRKYNFVPFKS